MADPASRPSLGARASYWAYRGGAAAANAIPESMAVPVAERLGRALAPVMRGRREIVERNLRRVAGAAPGDTSVPAPTGDVFASYGRYWLELFRLPRDARTPGEIEARFHIDGMEHIQAGIDAGTGVVLALPHVGGFDFAAAWLATQGLAPTVVVEPVEPPELFEWFAGVRRALGMDVVPLGPDAAPKMLRALADNRIICLLCDRDIAGDGVPVSFFGETTTMPGGPAVLALRSGAPLVPCAVYFEPGGGHHGIVEPPVPVERRGRLRDDVARVTQDLAHRFEGLIRRAPEQWHVLQPNWPSDHGDHAPVTAVPEAAS